MMERRKTVVCAVALMMTWSAADARPVDPHGAAAITHIGFELISWKRMASPNPGGGVNYESLMQIVDAERSDIGLAGMMVRCHDKKLETIFVVLMPLPPRTLARVRIRANGSTDVYDASLIPTGAGLVVPLDIVEEMDGPWHDIKDLGVDIEAGSLPISGYVPMQGLSEPLHELDFACKTQL